MLTQGDIDTDYRNSVLTKSVGVASFTVLVWDHMLTFSDEVEYVWKGAKGRAAYLFLVVRFLFSLCTAALIVD
jgi:hypothetical protein